MEFFHDVNIDWLGKKWYFLAFSLIFSISGLLSLFFWHGLPLGVDFKGGTLIYLKFDQSPNLNRIRQAADRAGLHDVSIVTLDIRKTTRSLFRCRSGTPRRLRSIPGGPHRANAAAKLRCRWSRQRGQAGPG